MTAALTKRRGPESSPKISTKDMIREIAEHTGVPYDHTSDVVYALLHYLRYSAMATEQKILIRNFGSFFLTRTKGRVYGAHVGAAAYRPDRIKLAVTSDLTEVDRWKNMQLIQKNVVHALDAALKPYSMDLAVCARIADLVLSNPNMTALTGPDRINLLREWVYATGASPLIPAVTNRVDFDNKPFSSIRFRLHAEERDVIIFDRAPSAMSVSASLSSKNDLVFFPTGWTTYLKVRQAMRKHDPQQPLLPELVEPIGTTSEAQCKSLYLAYKATKYGVK